MPAPYKTIHVFPPNSAKGLPARPTTGVTFGPDGNLYGITALGGACHTGTVYSFSTSGVPGSHYTLGRVPGGTCQEIRGGTSAGVLAYGNNNIYGTTLYVYGGGTQVSEEGAVFNISGGKVSRLYVFQPDAKRGGTPSGTLIVDKDGNVFGTTRGGGSASAGVLYKVSPSGTETIMHNFGAASGAGAYPNSGLIADPAGNLYGTTERGGRNNAGTLFKLTPEGAFRTVYSFGSFEKDGKNPNGNLALNPSGNIFGATRYGGGVHDKGTIYKIDPTGHETILYSFGDEEVFAAVSGVALDGDGNIYGLGIAKPLSCHCPDVYRLTPSGVVSVLYTLRDIYMSFESGGSLPAFVNNLAVGTDGWLYGTFPIDNDDMRSGVLYAVQYKTIPTAH